MNTNININSRDAVAAAFVWKLPTYFVLTFLTILFVSLVPTWKKNSQIDREKFEAYTKVKTECMRWQLEQYGDYDSVQCGRVANARAPYYR